MQPATSVQWLVPGIRAYDEPPGGSDIRQPTHGAGRAMPSTVAPHAAQHGWAQTVPAGLLYDPMAEESGREAVGKSCCPSRPGNATTGSTTASAASTHSTACAGCPASRAGPVVSIPFAGRTRPWRMYCFLAVCWGGYLIAKDSLLNVISLGATCVSRSESFGLRLWRRFQVINYESK